MKESFFLRSIMKDNAVLGIVIGVCPVLAVTRTGQEGLALGLVMVMVIFLGNLTVSIFKKFATGGVKIPFFIMTAALYASIMEAYFRIYQRPLYHNLGIFLPLSAVNCLIIWRMDESALRNPPLRSALDGLGFGVGFLAATICVSLIRELLGKGILLGWPLLGPGFRDAPMLFFASPAGGFLILGLLVALYKKFLKGGKS